MRQTARIAFLFVVLSRLLAFATAVLWDLEKDTESDEAFVDALLGFNENFLSIAPFSLFDSLDSTLSLLFDSFIWREGEAYDERNGLNLPLAIAERRLESLPSEGSNPPHLVDGNVTPYQNAQIHTEVNSQTKPPDAAPVADDGQSHLPVRSNEFGEAGEWRGQRASSEPVRIRHARQFGAGKAEELSSGAMLATGGASNHARTRRAAPEGTPSTGDNTNGTIHLSKEFWDIKQRNVRGWLELFGSPTKLAPVAWCSREVMSVAVPASGRNFTLPAFERGGWATWNSRRVRLSREGKAAPTTSGADGDEAEEDLDGDGVWCGARHELAFFETDSGMVDAWVGETRFNECGGYTVVTDDFEYHTNVFRAPGPRNNAVVTCSCPLPAVDYDYCDVAVRWETETNAVELWDEAPPADPTTDGGDPFIVGSADSKRTGNRRGEADEFTKAIAGGYPLSVAATVGVQSDISVLIAGERVVFESHAFGVDNAYPWPWECMATCEAHESLAGGCQQPLIVAGCPVSKELDFQILEVASDGDANIDTAGDSRRGNRAGVSKDTTNTTPGAVLFSIRQFAFEEDVKTYGAPRPMTFQCQMRLFDQPPSVEQFCSTKVIAASESEGGRISIRRTGPPVADRDGLPSARTSNGRRDGPGRAADEETPDASTAPAKQPPPVLSITAVAEPKAVGVELDAEVGVEIGMSPSLDSAAGFRRQLSLMELHRRNLQGSASRMAGGGWTSGDPFLDHFHNDRENDGTYGRDSLYRGATGTRGEGGTASAFGADGGAGGADGGAVYERYTDPLSGFAADGGDGGGGEFGARPPIFEEVKNDIIWDEWHVLWRRDQKDDETQVGVGNWFGFVDVIDFDLHGGKAVATGWRDVIVDAFVEDHGARYGAAVRKGDYGVAVNRDNASYATGVNIIMRGVSVGTLADVLDRDYGQRIQVRHFDITVRHDFDEYIYQDDKELATEIRVIWKGVDVISGTDIVDTKYQISVGVKGTKMSVLRDFDERQTGFTGTWGNGWKLMLSGDWADEWSDARYGAVGAGQQGRAYVAVGAGIGDDGLPQGGAEVVLSDLGLDVDFVEKGDSRYLGYAITVGKFTYIWDSIVIPEHIRVPTVMLPGGGRFEG